MSEVINNREYRQELLKQVIKELHEGKTVQEVKEKFAEVIEGVSPGEISRMEVELVKEGLPIEEIQHLCNVHAEVFRGTLEEIHHPEQVPGHPVYTFKRENEALIELMDETITPNLAKFKEDDSKENIERLIENINLLWDIDKHYSRKENLVFPFLEKYGVTSPPKVMWGKDDEIRVLIKDAKLSLTNYKGEKEEVIKKVEEALYEVKEMIYKEEKILFPMCIDTLTEDEWIAVYNESDEVGFTLVVPETTWKIKRVNLEKEAEHEGLDKGEYLKFETGLLTADEIESLFNTIPGEISFIDKNNIVKFFTKGDERIFTRTKAVIGRSVENCHPPASVHVVESIVNDFRTGKKDSEDFWIQKGDMFVLIRFFAVRNKEGEYLGTLEYVQNIKSLRELDGEKRLMSK